MRTHEYARRDGRSLCLDVHPAAGPDAPSAGTVVYVHGGGFVLGDRAMDGDRVRALAAHGVNVVVPDYRLAPSSHYPDPVDDVCDAVLWVGEHLDEIGTTNSAVALWGASAGATLAGLAGLMTDAAPGVTSTRVRAVVSWFGINDIASSAARSPLETQIVPPGPASSLLGVADLSTVPDLVREASPLSHVGPSAPPFLIAHGDRDQVVPPVQSQLLHDALVRAGGSPTLTVLGGAGHEDPRFDHPATIAATAAFLRVHLQQTP